MVNQTQQQHPVSNVQRQPPQQQRLVCWNCDGKGHPHKYCLAPRNVFCYGCGYKNVFGKCDQAGKSGGPFVSLVKRAPFFYFFLKNKNLFHNIQRIIKICSIIFNIVY
jgi:hypothetical protein